MGLQMHVYIYIFTILYMITWKTNKTKTVMKSQGSMVTGCLWDPVEECQL